MRAVTFAAAAVASLTAACAVTVAPPRPPVPPVVVVPPVGTDTCGAAAYQGFVGQRSPAITLPAGAVFRDYRTGDPVTTDFRPERINFEYSRAGRLVKVTCG